MWNLTKIESTDRNLKFCLTQKDAVITNLQWLELLKDSASFCTYYNDILANTDFNAFFWENKPITEASLSNRYECNIIKSEFLAKVSPNSQTFSRYFDEDKSIVSFPNLGKDAQLIVPCPAAKNDHSDYTHIGNFVRNAGDDQILKFWQQVGTVTLKYVDENPLWVSTSGLGVFWLHARLDSYPKYYQTEEYKSI